MKKDAEALKTGKQPTEYVVVGGGRGGGGIRVRKRTHTKTISTIKRLMVVLKNPFGHKQPDLEESDSETDLHQHTVKEEDMHLVMPQALHPDYDADFRQEVRDDEKTESLRQVSISSIDCHHVDWRSSLLTIYYI